MNSFINKTPEFIQKITFVILIITTPMIPFIGRQNHYGKSAFCFLKIL